MYQKKDKSYFKIAVIFYIILFPIYIVMGVLYRHEEGDFLLLPWTMLIAANIICLVRDQSLKDLGFIKSHRLFNFIIAIIILVAGYFAVFCISSYSYNVVLRFMIITLLNVGIFEEIIFRGFLQSYLFGLNAKPIIIYMIGGLTYSFTYALFPGLGLSYYRFTVFQLLSSFLCHIVFCFITKKTKSIMIPIALHTILNLLISILAINYLPNQY